MKLVKLFFCTVASKVSVVSVVSDKIIFGIQNQCNGVVSNGTIFHVVLNISEVSVVSDNTIWHAVFKIIVANVIKLCVAWYWKSLVKLYFICCMSSVIKVYLVFKIIVVSVVSDEIIFHVVLNISVVSLVSDSL